VNLKIEVENRFKEVNGEVYSDVHNINWTKINPYGFMIWIWFVQIYLNKICQENIRIVLNRS